MDSRREALLREASEGSLTDSTLTDKLAELDSEKPRPFGTLHAVSSSLLTPFWFWLQDD